MSVRTMNGTLTTELPSRESFAPPPDSHDLPMTVRSASREDAEQLVPLFTQLGYPTDATEISRRLRRNATSEYAAWVFDAGSGSGVVGFAAGHLLLPYENDPAAAQLMILVVDERHRATGAGTALVNQFESWATARGARRAVVSSGLDRVATHEFYVRRGYKHTGARFGRQL